MAAESPQNHSIITKPQLYSNKPSLPDPTPSKKLFPDVLTLNDGRKVWVSLPMLDKISIIFEVKPSLYAKHISSDIPAGKLANSFYEYCANNDSNVQILLGKSKNFQSIKGNEGETKSWSKICLEVGVREASVYITQLRRKKSPFFRIEMNPRKVGYAGLSALANLIGGEKAPFDLAAVATNARFTKADFCIDMVGIGVDEVAIYHSQQGTRWFWQGSNNSLETVYLFRKAKIPDPSQTGKSKARKLSQLAKIYDRVEERASVGKPPPFGNCPVTRVEVSKRYNGKFLNGIAELLCPFQDLRVGFLRDQFEGQSGRWLKYYTLRRTVSPIYAQKLLGLPKHLAPAFEASEKVPKANLIDAKSVWLNWKQSLSLFGINQLIAPGSSS